MKKKLVIKNQYVGWDFKPNLKDIKFLYIKGISNPLDFKIISVDDIYDDGKGRTTVKCQDAMISMVVNDELTLNLNLKELIKDHDFYFD